MTIVASAGRARRVGVARPLPVTPGTARAALVVVALVAATAGALATPGEAAGQAAAAAGDDLTRLLRFMAAIKGAMALGAVAAILWRLGTSTSLPRLIGYAVAAGAMAAGPGLIWGMAHVGAGALLLHGGLLAAGVLLWFDPAVAGRLDAVLATRRRR